MKVSGNTKLPKKKWNDFLLDPKDRQELFDFFTAKVCAMNIPEGRRLYITSGDSVKCKGRRLYTTSGDSVKCKGRRLYITSGDSVKCKGTEEEMAECNHEEADTRIMTHVKDVLENGDNVVIVRTVDTDVIVNGDSVVIVRTVDTDNVVIVRTVDTDVNGDSVVIVRTVYTDVNGDSVVIVRTVDTDVIVLLVGMFHYFREKNPSAEIWVAFGTGKIYCYYNVNTIFEKLGRNKSISLPPFHAFTGCDSTSSFFGRSKKSAWLAWNACPEVAEALLFIAANPYASVNLLSPHYKPLERFTEC